MTLITTNTRFDGMSRMAGISSGRITEAGATIKLPGEIPYKQLFAL
jgi:hypothetical protein